MRYAAHGQTSGVAQSEVGVVVEGEPFWLDEKAGTNHSAVSMRLSKCPRYKSDISYCVAVQ